MNTYNLKFDRITLMLIIFIAIIAMMVYLFIKIWNHSESVQIPNSGPYFTEGSSKTASEVRFIQANISGARNNSIVQAIRKIGGSVVSISTVHLVRDPWFEFFYPFSGERERKYYGLGSGFIIDERGYIATNYHVIEDADVIKVTLTNGKEYQAAVIGGDKESDIAVLKINADDKLTVAELGNSSDVLVGEWVIAIGNPFGYLMKDSQPTVTVGVISATGRSFQKDDIRLKDLIQTDAAINPGNSGGPLVNSYGQVIGINTAIFSTTGGYQGVGFAIPINTAKKIIIDLIERGMLLESWVGLEYQELNNDLIQHLGLSVNEGVLITYVAENSPAEKAGLKEGDVIVMIGKQRVNSIEKIAEICTSLSTKDSTVFRILRKDKFIDVNLKPENPEISGIAKKLIGIIVQSPTPESSLKYSLSSYRRGVMVIHVVRKSPAEKAKLKKGDLIVKMLTEKTETFKRIIIDKDINNLNDFNEFVSDISKGQIIKIVLERKQELWQTYLTASTD